jgi:hypothetical protein
MTTEEFRILKKSVAEAYAKHENEDLLKQVDSLTAKVEELKGLIKEGINFNNDQVWVNKAEQALKK